MGQRANQAGGKGRDEEVDGGDDANVEESALGQPFI